MAANKAPILAVCGFKNSGKTTLIEALLPHLAAAGLRVAVIKHDGHDFTPDVPGSDSWRHSRAGAVGVAVYSPERWMVTRRGQTTPEDLAAHFPDAHLILMEGGKNGPWPKLALTRNMEPGWDPQQVVAWVEPNDDPAGVAQLIWDWRERHG